MSRATPLRTAVALAVFGAVVAAAVLASQHAGSAGYLSHFGW